MAVSNTLGRVHVAIDMGCHREIGTDTVVVARRTAATLGAAGVSFSWNVPGAQLMMCILPKGSPPAEVTIQMPDSTVLGRDGLTSFLSQLDSDARELRSLGHDVVGISLSSNSVPSWLHRIRAFGFDFIRGPVGSTHERMPHQQSRMGRFGLWYLPVTAMFPAYGRLLGAWDPGYRSKQILARCTHKHSSEVICISIPELSRAGLPAGRALDSLLRIMALLREAGQVRCESFQDCCARLRTCGKAQPQRSILQKAA